MLAFLPAITLAAFWLGGETALLVTALAVPLVVALAMRAPATPGTGPRDAATGLALRESVPDFLDAALAEAAQGRHTACLVLTLDDPDQLLRRHGHTGYGAILQQSARRLETACRSGDHIARLEGGSFAVALAPVPRADLNDLLQMAARLQEALEAAISLDATTVHVSVSVGFCLASHAPAPGGAALLEAAELAMDCAHHNGPSAIRAFTTDIQRARADQTELRRTLAPALENGELRPWFQPQISTDTGALTGMETLARWVHPTRGVLTPGSFLPALIDSGLSERLSEAMLGAALRALRDWDRAGLSVPSVAVNFAPEELRNPLLPEKVKWELDRFDLAPERLTVEILETVIARTDDDMIVQTIGRLAQMGCRIDLDDFGTGHASITSIRRFAVSRIKIDRSFVHRIDRDRDQQRLVAAILSMAERLGLETLAEGVETAGEHAILAQLGCGHVQGYGIAHPMPLADVAPWIERHKARQTRQIQIGKRIG